MSKKFNFSGIFKCLLAFQFVWVQHASATNTDNSLNQKVAMIASIQSLQTGLDLVSLEAGKADIAEATTQLKNAGVDVSQKINLSFKNGSLFLGPDEIKINKNEMNYKGMIFRYNSSRSFSQNIESFTKRLSPQEAYSKFSLFINYAHAVNKKDAAVAVTAAATVLGIVGFVVASIPLAAVGAAVGVASFTTALAAEEGPSYKDVKEFKCLADGWTLKTKQGVIVKATESSSGDVQVEVVGKSGEKTIKTLSGAHKDSFLYTKRTCAEGNGKMAQSMSKMFIPNPALGFSPKNSQSSEGVK